MDVRGSAELLATNQTVAGAAFSGTVDSRLAMRGGPCHPRLVVVDAQALACVPVFVEHYPPEATSGKEETLDLVVFGHYEVREAMRGSVWREEIGPPAWKPLGRRAVEVLVGTTVRASLDRSSATVHNLPRVCVHRARRTSDIEEINSGLEELDRTQFVRVEAALKRRQQGLEADVPCHNRESRPISSVAEYCPHADSTLQKEVRRYYRKDGTAKEQGPYWYFRYHEGGRQRTLYLGTTDDPEGELARKRADG